jgi:hypothetical protein
LFIKNKKVLTDNLIKLYCKKGAIMKTLKSVYLDESTVKKAEKIKAKLEKDSGVKVPFSSVVEKLIQDYKL